MKYNCKDLGFDNDDDLFAAYCSDRDNVADNPEFLKFGIIDHLTFAEWFTIKRHEWKSRHINDTPDVPCVDLDEDDDDDDEGTAVVDRPIVPDPDLDDGGVSLDIPEPELSTFEELKIIDLS